MRCDECERARETVTGTVPLQQYRLCNSESLLAADQFEFPVALQSSRSLANSRDRANESHAYRNFENRRLWRDPVEGGQTVAYDKRHEKRHSFQVQGTKAMQIPGRVIQIGRLAR